MKLHEEFKLVEELWEDDFNFEDFYAERERKLKAAKDAEAERIRTNPVIRTFGRKTYNLADTNELFAWWRANLEFQMKRYPDKYKGYRGVTNDYKLHTTIANNLIKALKADGVTDEKIFKELEDMAGGNSKLAASREDVFNKAKSAMYGVAEAYLGDNIRKVSWDDLTAIIEKATDSLLIELESFRFR
jgi:hypothetical protein